MSALVEALGILAITGFIVWGYRTGAPAVTYYREVDEDEPCAPIEWGPGDEF